jgi:hypothetical protein
VKPAQSGSVWRLAGRTAATPVLWYAHPAKGGRLIVILNTHIAEPGYFATMRACITALHAKGWTVQLEGLNKASGQDWAAAADDERRAHEVMLRLIRDRAANAARYLGWITQYDKEAGLRPDDAWCTDLTDLEIIRRIGAGHILALGRRADDAMARFGRYRAGWENVTTPLVFRLLARPHDALTAAIARTAPDVYAELNGGRSRHAAAAVDPAADTVIAWGSEHADTIHDALTAAGWTPTGKRRWLTVGKLPPLARSMADVTVVAWRAASEQAPSMTIGDALRQARQDWKPASE